MSKKPMSYHLTPSERSIMDILWNAKSSMSQASIVEKAKDADTMTWKERSIFSMVNSLLAKGIIEEDSFIRSGKLTLVPSNPPQAVQSFTLTLYSTV